MVKFGKLRQSKGYSIPQFCALAGISGSSLYRIEHSNKDKGVGVSLLTAGRACRALGIDLADVEDLYITDQEDSDE